MVQFPFDAPLVSGEKCLSKKSFFQPGWGEGVPNSYLVVLTVYNIYTLIRANTVQMTKLPIRHTGFCGFLHVFPSQ